MPVRGHEGGFARQAARIETAPLQQNRARRLLQPGQGAHQFGLTIALDTGDADDLAVRHGKADIIELSAAERLHRKVDVVGASRSLGWECRAKCPADDQAQQLFVANFIDSPDAANLAVAQHGDPLGDLAYLCQAVCDVDDGRPGFDQLPDMAEEHVGRFLAERSGRFVEDEHPGLDGERLGDLEQVLLRHGQGIGSRMQGYVQAHILQRGFDRRMSRFLAEPLRRKSNLEILEHRKIIQNGGVLIRNRYSKRCGELRRNRRNDAAAELDLAAIGLQCAGYDIHERRFARPVFAEERMNLPLVEFGIDVLKCRHTRIVFGDIRQPNADGRRHRGFGYYNFFCGQHFKIHERRSVPHCLSSRAASRSRSVSAPGSQDRVTWSRPPPAFPAGPWTTCRSILGDPHGTEPGSVHPSWSSRRAGRRSLPARAACHP